jgi:hypothetical protein
MKNLKLTFSLVCVALLLTGGQLFGQSKKGKDGIVTPLKGDNYKEIAAQMSRDGWKTDSYTIEEQLISTAQFKGQVNPKSNDALYLWVQQESSGSNLRDVKEKNYISGVTSLTYHVEVPYLSQCKLILMQKRGSAEQMSALERIILQITPMVVQNLSSKTMEIYQEKDKTYTVRSVYMIDKSKVYDILTESCIRDASGYKDNAILIEVFKEALNRMAKQSLR